MISPLRRCLLFVPGCRPDRFEKAAASGADAICLDLEDSVPPAEKERARAAVIRFLLETRGERLVERAVRINAPYTPEGEADLQALIKAKCAPDFLLLPKIRSREDLRNVAASWGGACPPVMALVELPSAVLAAEEIAKCAPAGLMFGAVDLAAELGVASDSDLLGPVRAGVVVAAKAARVAILDTPHLTLRDEANVIAEARHARAWGFTGKAAIHPAQVPLIQAAFAPTAEEVDRAERALAVFYAAGQGAIQFEGRLLEKPVIDGYRRILQAARPGGIS